MTALAGVARTSSTAGGAVLAAATRGVAALRPAAKPLHPRGTMWEARIHRHGAAERSGVAWLDDPGEDAAVVRVSRAIGLPDGWPDIHGLAVRVEGSGGAGDLLFATTGWGRVTRFVLTASRHPDGRPLTTLLPYRTPIGPVLLGARSVGPQTYALSWTRGAGSWHRFANLRLADRLEDGTGISFDPLLHRLPGLDQYPSITRLREPAYLRARRSRTRS